MPNKHNTERRHHIPKMKFKVQNWPEFDILAQVNEGDSHC